MPDIPTEIQNQTFEVIYPPPVEEVDLNQDPQTVHSYPPCSWRILAMDDQHKQGQQQHKQKQEAEQLVLYTCS